MRDLSRLHPDTLAAHGGGAVDTASGGVVPPIQPATTFRRGPDYALLNPANIYSRDDSEALRAVETLLAALEGGAGALAFPSGMAATAAVFRTLPAGARVVLQSGIYWGTTKWVRDFCARRGVTLVEVDAADAHALGSACAEPTALVFVETPSNPWLKTVDIRAAAAAAHEVGALLVVDSTAATPVLTRPLGLGADLVMHSATKGLNGHSDVLAGALVTADAGHETWARIATDRHDAGAVLGPFEAWLLLRGMRTLPLRMARMSATALELAQRLSTDARVADVFYPGLPGHAGHDIAVAQMTGGFGGLMSFLVRGDRQTALEVVGRLELFQRATSLGGVESLVEHRATIEPDSGIPETLIRLSVGIEDAGDLWADLDRALG
ncbi:aminotransferase class I/II-fold pyridoxal phosphate-dependent enzyme [Dinoroseobacter sp. PD6]|uniref:trans-sulfuration enzyme family protein n=1 Tax=Dinoroseobacter sp. PD6 TaxID=3028384 RepID=UPI00237BF0B8|nr:aminotransferase class I/II-fold pyridoxal phosphate-dependent enzyme [Dinoroseobacter sp. PD6]MDD9715843.1 aminotransferase class I/II-fold pyridoxal phosphate-dependent enzyme [Dinoroseobacter sp. PD6]